MVNYTQEEEAKLIGEKKEEIAELEKKFAGLNKKLTESKEKGAKLDKARDEIAEKMAKLKKEFKKKIAAEVNLWIAESKEKNAENK